MSHDEDVRLVRSGCDERIEAIDRILARHDALMEEHEAVGAYRIHCEPNCKPQRNCVHGRVCAAHDKVEELLHRT